MCGEVLYLRLYPLDPGAVFYPRGQRLRPYVCLMHEHHDGPHRNERGASWL